MNYNRIQSMELVATCVGVTQEEWDQYMLGVKRANKAVINRLVKKFLPDLYHDLALNFHNPYNYFKKEGLIVLVHSHIEYFIKTS